MIAENSALPPIRPEADKQPLRTRNDLVMPPAAYTPPEQLPADPLESLAEDVQLLLLAVGAISGILQDLMAELRAKGSIDG